MTLKELSRQSFIFYLYFLISLVYFFGTQHSNSTIYIFFSRYMMYIMILMSIIAFVIYFAKYSFKQKMLICLLAMLSFVNWWIDDYYGLMLWIYIVLIVGAKDIKFKNLVRFHLHIEIVLCLVNIISFYIGLSDMVNYHVEERESVLSDIVTRYNPGYPAATDFATHILYMLIDYWILKGCKLKWFDYLLYFILFYVAFSLIDARQASICILLIIICSIFVKYMYKKHKRFNSTLGISLIMGIPFLFIGTYIATISYDASNPVWILTDLLFSGRFSAGLNAFQEYGISWFGQNIKLVGTGYAGGLIEYNYVDSAYLQYLIRWGWVWMTISMIVFVKIGGDAYKRNDFILLFSLTIVGFSSVTTQYLFLINYCMLFLALTASHHKSNIIRTAVKR